MNKNDLRAIVPADFYLMSKDELLTLKTAIMAFLHNYQDMVYSNEINPQEALYYVRIECLLSELDNYIKELFLDDINDEIIGEIVGEFEGLDLVEIMDILDILDEDEMLIYLEIFPLSELVYIPEFEDMPDEEKLCIKTLEKIFHCHD